MGKKMRFGSFFTWPSCKHPKTESFRAGDGIYKTINSIYLDMGTPESWFTNSSESVSFSTESEESPEMIVRRGLRSDRFFFEPDETKSILEEAKKECGFGFKESVVLAMDSEDPYVDFRVSMEEMVEAHGLKDWECLEDLLQWYLKMNGKKTHGFIVGAFVDLLIGLVSSSFECEEEGGEDGCSSSSSSSET
ncbi:transcription repressor OFP13-like [Tasmannia lanceolata]|uniref:transcription repressor OFP13-like n=1 Tax=Tasmannia lanceolata TaxID=3420 RepID=UPI004063DDEF